MASTGHERQMAAVGLVEHELEAETSVEQDASRLREMVREHYDLVWRLVRRFGVHEAEAEDAVQHVFMVASRRLADIEAGREKSFLSSSAVRVASQARRAARRRPVELHPEVYETGDPSPGPDELADQRRAREMLDEILGRMPEDLRTVFVLFEIEEMITREIAELVNIPIGTVASRLRRAREWFERAVTETKTLGGGRKP